MDAKSRANKGDAVYEEFEPSTRWAREAKFDTLIVHLPGFKKEQLRVQTTSSRKLRIGGERSLGNNKWSRFQKEFLIDSNYDTNEISAKFEGGELHIKHPKIIAQADYKAADAKAEAEAKAKPEAEAEAKAQTEAPKTQKIESDHSKAEKKGKEQEQAREADASKTTSMEKQPSKKASGVRSASDNVDKTASRKGSEKKSGEDLSEERKSTSATEKMEKEKNLEDAAAKAEKEAAGSSNRSTDKFRVEEMKQALGWLVMEMKGQRKLVNMIVVVLLVLVAWVFTKRAVGSLGKSKN